ncbi:hypothetical protein KSS87_014722, partial [Heliosperma pusillum]
YIRDLLLNPPAYTTAAKIQDVCKLMSSVTCSMPEFTCLSSAKLVKLLELREANHIEFNRIKNVAEEILQLHGNTELCEILKLLMDPTCVLATGLKLESDKLTIHHLYHHDKHLTHLQHPKGGEEAWARASTTSQQVQHQAGAGAGAEGEARASHSSQQRHRVAGSGAEAGSGAGAGAGARLHRKSTKNINDNAHF